jgi:glycosyl transferase family 25
VQHFCCTPVRLCIPDETWKFYDYPSFFIGRSDQVFDEMNIQIYVINLDRSPSRWERISAQAAEMGLNVIRVVAVDGAAVAPEDWIDADPRQFLQMHGRYMLPGEYGCYRSHLLALQQFGSSRGGDAEIAIIVEDDIDLTADLVERARAIHQALPQAGLVKLFNHRTRGFRPKVVSARDDVVGRCLHGPQGSAACYFVTRAAARTLLKTLGVMKLPYDIAVERGWDSGVETYTVRDNLTALGPLYRQTAIAHVAQYRKTKTTRFKRIATHLFRARDYLCRLAYACKM